MDKFEYGDLNRFLVSFGLALVAGSVAVFWLFFREPFDLVRTAEELQKLTPLAREIIQLRQEWTQRALQVLPYVSLVGLTFGTTCLIVGIARWIPMQREAERIQLVTRQKLERELQNMTPAEVVEKAKTEVSLQTSAVFPAGETGTETSKTVQLDAAVADYLGTEAVLFDALAERLPAGYFVTPHQKISNYAFDALISSDRDSNANFILEFKKLGAGANARHLGDALRNASYAADWAGMFKDDKTYVPLVIAVTPNLEARLIERSQQLIEKDANHPTAFGRSLLRLITPQRLATLSAKDAEALLDTKRRFLVLPDWAPGDV